ncbi:MAG: MFS transporter [Mesorhizobium sp. 61-13]|nr:MAG: MFS transporter [Mesorhizobium sp. 61-13]
MEQPTSSPLRFAVAGMISLAVAMGIGRFVYTPILPGMMEELELSASNAGLIASANYLGYLVGALVAAGGWAHGRERMVVFGALAASTILVALMGAVETMTPFLVIRFLAGVASAFVMVFMTSIVFSHLARSGRAGFEAVHFGGVGIGIAGSSILMAAIVTIHAGWTAAWFWSGALSLAGFVLVVLLANEGPVGGANSKREPALPRNASLAKIILSYGLFGFGYVITATFIVAIVRQSGESRVFEAMVWLATGLTAVPSLFVWQRVARRSNVYSAYAIACLVEAVGVAASVAVTGRIGPLAGGILLGATFMAPTALGIQAARQLAPLSTRKVFAIMTAAFGLGQIIGPIVAGILAEWSGSFFVPSMLAAGVLVLSAAAAWSAAPKSP